MKSWFIQSSPESTAVELRDVPVPEPKAGEVLARIRAAGLNRGEFIAGHGLSGTGAKAGGIEGAGEVVKAGEGVANFKAGDRIMGRASGAYSEFALFRASYALPAPAALSWEEAAGGKGVDLVVNNVGGTVFAECIRALAYRGRLATVGYVDGVVTAELDILALHAKRLKLFGVSNKLRGPAEVAEGVRGFARDVLPAFASGHLKPVVDKVFAFAELPQAKATMESNAHLGKIILRN